jgi:hypothetical protein
MLLYFYQEAIVNKDWAQPLQLVGGFKYLFRSIINAGIVQGTRVTGPPINYQAIIIFG